MFGFAKVLLFDCEVGFVGFIGIVATVESASHGASWEWLCNSFLSAPPVSPSLWVGMNYITFGDVFNK